MKHDIQIEVRLTIDGERRVFDLDEFGYDDRGTNMHDPSGLSGRIVEAMQAALFTMDGNPKLKGM
jgi:hypothetical protein